MGKTRVLDFADLQSSSTVPSVQGTSKLVEFVDNASYELVYGAGVLGSLYMNSTYNNIFFHDGNTWKQNEAELNAYGQAGVPVVGNDGTQGFSIGSVWEFNSRFWVCKDNATGAAVWIEYAQNYDQDIIDVNQKVDDLEANKVDPNTTAIGNNATAISNLEVNKVDPNTTAIGLNTAKVSADGSVATHSDVTDAGSGEIITSAERIAIGTNTTDIGTNSGRLDALEAIPTTQTIPLLDIDWSLKNVYEKTISTNETYTFSNDVDGKTIVVALFNNSGAAVNVNFPTAHWQGGAALTEIPANSKNVYTFIKIGSIIYANAVDAMTAV